MMHPFIEPHCQLGDAVEVHERLYIGLQQTMLGSNLLTVW